MTTPSANATTNPILQAIGAGGAAAPAAPSSSDTTRFGLTATELGTTIGVQPDLANAGMAASLYGNAPTPAEMDPFGIGVPMATPGGVATVQDLIDYIQQLPPAQLAQVQAQLANAGFYGPMNSPTEEPHWGQLGTVDAKALQQFAKTLINGATNGSSIQSVLMRSTQQFSSQQQAMNKLTPIRDLGKNYTIVNLDPAEAGDMVDAVALKVLGHTLDPAQRQQYATWLDQQYTSRQMAADRGDIQQNALNAQAVAQASDWTNPYTGAALDLNATVSAARSQLGVRYVWGGEQPGQAFDCSGLTQWVYGQSGIKLPRTSQEQWNSGGGTRFTDEAQAQPGDLVFFGGDGTGPTHVGIYIGNGMMIDAPHTGATVRMDNVDAFAQGDQLVGFEHFDQVNNQQIAATNLPPGTAPASTGTGGGSELDSFMAAEKQQESGGDYSVTNPSGASGAYQMLQGAWNEWAAKAGFGQYVGRPAASAPPSVQDAVARTAFQSLYQQYGNWADVAASWYSGQPLNPATENNPQQGGPTIKQYADMIVSKMGGASTPAASGTSSSDPGVALTGATDANGGRSIISTPNTFTQATDETSTALQDALALRLRQDFPAQAAGADYANAYNMLMTAIDTKGFKGATAGSTTQGTPGG